MVSETLIEGPEEWFPERSGVRQCGTVAFSVVASGVTHEENFCYFSVIDGNNTHPLSGFSI